MSGIFNPPHAGRTLLSANRTYFVATTGNDSNNGLTVGAPFLTLQKAWDVIVTLDLGGFVATIQIADGTYTAGINAIVGPVGGNVVINGNSGTPANVIVSVAGDAIKINSVARVTLQNFELRTTGIGVGAAAQLAGAYIEIGTGMRFGACVFGMQAVFAGKITITANYTYAGNTTYHRHAAFGGVVSAVASTTCTVSGTPAHTAFAAAGECGLIQSLTETFSGSATGSRYNAALNGVIQAYGGGASYFPGDSVGATATGGQYA